MQNRDDPNGIKQWMFTLLAISIAAASGCAGGGQRTAIIPDHLLRAHCVHARTLPGDPLADPILFAGCDDRSRSEFIRRNIASTVLIFVGRYDREDQELKYFAGTGTIIDADGTVVTAFHVVDGAEYVNATLQELAVNGQSVRRLRDMPMRIAAVSPENDAALLRPSHKTAWPGAMPLCRHRLPARGELLWHFGRTTTWAAGQVTETAAVANGVRVMEVDVRINFGDSGGPLVNARGELTGITLAKNGTNTMYFVPIGQALDALGFSGGVDACPE